MLPHGAAASPELATITCPVLENLLRQGDSTYRTPLRKMFSAGLMFACSNPTNPKKERSVCMSLE